MFVMPACYKVGDTIYFPFDTYNSSGASVTITGLAVTDIEVYKNGSMTQRASDNGYTLLDTDGIDLDGTTGFHGFSIDTSDNSDAGFWEDGSTVLVNVNAITVDGQTVTFTYLLPLGMSLRPTTAGRTLDVSAGGEAGIDWANIGSPTTTVNLSGTSVKTATDVETDTADIQSRLPAALTADGNIKADTLRVGGTLQTAGDLAALLADIPTVAEFNARTLAAADYFDPAADTVANVTTVGSVTAKTGYSLASTGLDLITIDGKTLPVAMHHIAAAAVGKLSGAGTGTEVMKGLDGTTTRITATVDSSGNRTAITYTDP